MWKWWRGALVALFAIIGIVVLFGPFPELTYVDLPEYIFACVSGRRERLLDHYLSQEHLTNDPDGRKVVDMSSGQVFPYDQLSRLARCKKIVLFRDPPVAALEYCGVVFVTTEDRVIEHIITRDVFDAHREAILTGARKSFLARFYDGRREGKNIPSACGPQKINPRGSGGSTEAEGGDSGGRGE